MYMPEISCLIVIYRSYFELAENRCMFVPQFGYGKCF